MHPRGRVVHGRGQMHPLGWAEVDKSIHGVVMVVIVLTRICGVPPCWKDVTLEFEVKRLAPDMTLGDFLK